MVMGRRDVKNLQEKPGVNLQGVGLGFVSSMTKQTQSYRTGGRSTGLGRSRKMKVSSIWCVVLDVHQLVSHASDFAYNICFSYVIFFLWESCRHDWSPSRDSFPLSLLDDVIVFTCIVFGGDDGEEGDLLVPGGISDLRSVLDIYRDAVLRTVRE